MRFFNTSSVANTTAVFMFAPENGKYRIVVPRVKGAVCPYHYLLDDDGSMLGHLPDAWLLQRDSCAEEMMELLSEDMTTIPRSTTLLETISWLVGGSVRGFEEGACPWRTTAREVASLCRLPSWLPILLEGDYGGQGIGHLVAPVIDWPNVARRLVPAGVNVTFAAGEWDDRSQVDHTLFDLPEGLRLACIAGSAALRVAPFVQEAPKPLRQRLQGQHKEPKRNNKPRQEEARREEPVRPPVYVTEVAQAPVTEIAPVVDPVDELCARLPEGVRGAFLTELQKEMEKLGPSPRDGAVTRVQMLTWNRAMKGQLAVQEAPRPTKAERRAAARAAAALAGGTEVAEENAPVPPAVVAPPTVEPMAVVVVTEEANAAWAGVTVEATPEPEPVTEAEEAPALIMAGDTVAQAVTEVAAEAAEAMGAFERALEELSPEQRQLADKRMAAGEDGEEVLLDILTKPAPVAQEQTEAPAKKTRKASTKKAKVA